MCHYRYKYVEASIDESLLSEKNATLNETLLNEKYIEFLISF